MPVSRSFFARRILRFGVFRPGIVMLSEQFLCPYTFYTSRLISNRGFGEIGEVSELPILSPPLARLHYVAAVKPRFALCGLTAAEEAQLSGVAVD